MSKLYTWISNFIKPKTNGCYVNSSYLGRDVEIGKKCKIFKASIDGRVNIGDRTSIYGPNTAILSKVNSISIGRYCSIASNVLVINYSHNTKRPSTYYFSQNIFGGNVSDDVVSKGDISIGNDVWIGAGSVILGGVSIGDGAVIGANSVVNHSVPPYAIVAGNPATVVKYRFSEEKIRLLLDMRWWDKSEEELINMKDFFLKDL